MVAMEQLSSPLDSHQSKKLTSCVGNITYRPHQAMSANHIINFIHSHIESTLSLIYIGAPFILLLLALEATTPKKKLNINTYIFNIIYMPIAIFISSLLIGTIRILTPASWLSGHIHLPQNPDLLTTIGTFFLYLIVFDFFYYWFHRAQHTLPWLWRYHAMHHSDINVSTSTTARHHWMEDTLRFLPVYVPLGIAFGDLRTFPAWAVLAPGLYGIFIHWNTPLRFKFLSRLVVTPWFHRIHHSIEKQHMNKNFSIFFLLLITFLELHFSQIEMSFQKQE